MFRQVPWIDEQVYKDKATEKTSNTQYTYEQLFGKVIDDFKFAYDNLPEKQSEGGRANKIAAAAYLAKCYLTLAWGDGYEATDGVSHINKDYMQKVVDYTDVVKASHYGYLEDYGDIFLPDYKNSKESIFAVQASDYSEDHTRYGRANWSNTLNGCWGIWSCGWDFHKPSQNLVNAYKTRNGLPEFTDYNDSDEYPVNGKPTAQKWDPRLFHTVGMPTFPYKYEPEYTLTKANSRTPNTYGYYTSMKEVPQRSKGESYNRPWQAFDMNDYVLRYTDVMLIRAEALIELGRLQEARTIINDIRQRAKNSIKSILNTPPTSATSLSILSLTSRTRRQPASACAGSADWRWVWRVAASSTCAAGASPPKLSTTISRARPRMSTTVSLMPSTTRTRTSRRVKTSFGRFPTTSSTTSPDCTRRIKATTSKPFSTHLFPT